MLEGMMMSKNYFTDEQVEDFIQASDATKREAQFGFPSDYVLDANQIKALMNLAVEAAIGEALVLEAPNYNNEAMGCGLEDRNITDRYEAMFYGFECGVERVFEQIPEALIYSVKELEN